MADNNPPPPPQQQQQQAPSAAQHQQSSQQPAGGAQASGSAAAASNEVETYPCNWNGCVEIYKNAELLYDHVCEKHVGRKSTNNLELKCHWGNCTTTTVKRDHITSHIRVHIPLKPHKCEVCGKTFKRPQDLKKHVKTHAEDPNAMMRNAQEAGAASRPPPQNGGFTNMHPSQQMHGYPGYMPMPPGQGVPFGAYPPQGGNVGHYAPTQPGQHPPFPAGNGMPFYPQGGPHNGHHSMYQARGNGHEAVDALFGDIKNRAFDPNNFSEVTQRLMNLPSQLQFPGNSGAHNFGSHISNGGGGGGGVYAPAPAVLHSTAQFNNLRTKDEHLQAENYLAQMHQTIYESPASITAAGVGQPGAVPLPQHPHQHQHQQLQQQQHFKQRQSHSPPSAIPSSGHVEDMRSSDTPALTPGSSAMSVKSEQSPTSVHSNVVSPTNNNHPAYPMLPSSLDSPTARMALASTLGNQHDHDQRRRHSGSNLQRAQPDTSDFQVSTFAMDMDGAAPDQSAARSRSSKKKQAPSPDLNIDPALAGPGPAATGSSSTDSSDADGNVTPTNDDGGPALASWLHYVRTLENMLSIVREKLARKDYVEDEPETTTDGVFAKSEAAAHPAQQQHHQLLSNQGRQISFVQEGVKNEANKDVDANSNNGQVAYPELKME